MTSKEIENIAQCYLYIFDMKPIYHELAEQNISELKNLINSKRFSALALCMKVFNAWSTNLPIFNTIF
jgi:hypothetical protein